MRKAWILMMGIVTLTSGLMGCGRGKGNSEEAIYETTRVGEGTGEAQWKPIGTASAPLSVKVMIKDVFPSEEDVQLLRKQINSKMASHGQYVDLEFVEPPAGSYATAVPIAMMNVNA